MGRSGPRANLVAFWNYAIVGSSGWGSFETALCSGAIDSGADEAFAASCRSRSGPCP